jgi:hypothetical protein
LLTSRLMHGGGAAIKGLGAVGCLPEHRSTRNPSITRLHRPCLTMPGYTDGALEIAVWEYSEAAKIDGQFFSEFSNSILIVR